jgi:hypothetical protein
MKFNFYKLVFVIIATSFVFARVAYSEPRKLELKNLYFNHELTCWVELRMTGLFDYSELDQNFIPKNLHVKCELCAFRFCFSYPTSIPVIYRYKMLGYEKNWHYTTKIKPLFYDLKKHGKYTLIYQVLHRNKIVDELRYGIYHDLDFINSSLDVMRLFLIIVIVYLFFKIK